MSDTLKPCPFCGPECSDTNGATAWCRRCGIVLSIHLWQSRPVEDALREELRVNAHLHAVATDQARQAEQDARDAVKERDEEAFARGYAEAESKHFKAKYANEHRKRCEALGKLYVAMSRWKHEQGYIIALFNMNLKADRDIASLRAKVAELEELHTDRDMREVSAGIQAGVPWYSDGEWPDEMVNKIAALRARVAELEATR